MILFASVLPSLEEALIFYNNRIVKRFSVRVSDNFFEKIEIVLIQISLKSSVFVLSKLQVKSYFNVPVRNKNKRKESCNNLFKEVHIGTKLLNCKVKLSALAHFGKSKLYLK